MIAPEGIFVFEAQYLADLLRTGAFDTIYHEHQCYFTLTVLSGLLSSFGLRCFDVQSIDAQGGSIRVWATPSNSAFEETLHFRTVMENEAAADTGGIKSIETIQQQASATGSALRETLGTIRESGGRIAAYAKKNSSLRMT